MNEKDFKRFDMKLPPRKVKWYLKPVIKALVYPAIWKYKPNIKYSNTENIKGPFLLLCNHNAFLDFKVATYLLGKNGFNYVVAIDGYLNREGLLRNVGCICKRKFTNDIILIRQLKRALDMGNVAVIYPEARYSLCGTNAVLPESLGKMCKLFKVPVVTLICHGHHINSPFWDTSHERNVKGIEAEYKLLLSPSELEEMTPIEINEKINEAFIYDDFKWQKDNKIEVSDKNRARNLHKVLYKCPNCKVENKMSSDLDEVKCNSCNKTWKMTKYGELVATLGDTEFSHIPDWYNWERECVKEEIKNGIYSTGILNVQVDTLPKAKFINLGTGTFIHDMNGFKVDIVDKDGDHHQMVKDVPSLYSCHIEYNYLFKHGDAIDLNTLEDTWYIFPEGDNFSVTKIALATEELYNHHKLNNN